MLSILQEIRELNSSQIRYYICESKELEKLESRNKELNQINMEGFGSLYEVFYNKHRYSHKPSQHLELAANEFYNNLPIIDLKKKQIERIFNSNCFLIDEKIDELFKNYEKFDEETKRNKINFIINILPYNLKNHFDNQFNQLKKHQQQEQQQEYHFKTIERVLRKY